MTGAAVGPPVAYIAKTISGNGQPIYLDDQHPILPESEESVGLAGIMIPAVNLQPDPLTSRKRHEFGLYVLFLKLFDLPFGTLKAMGMHFRDRPLLWAGLTVGFNDSGIFVGRRSPRTDTDDQWSDTEVPCRLWIAGIAGIYHFTAELPENFRVC